MVGCSTAYHLAKRGWTDVVLVERKRLTSGTTWHAAGLITQARPTYGTREIVRRSLRVFHSLEEETGFATGFERTGTLHLADGAERLEELLRQASAARSNGITAEPISPEQAVECYNRYLATHPNDEPVVTGWIREIREGTHASHKSI